MLLLVLVASFGSASASGLECPGEPASQLPESWPALSPLSGRRSPPRAARACSRKENNRRQRALHGNIHLVVANITALSKMRLALAERPDVLLAQELWASREPRPKLLVTRWQFPERSPALRPCFTCLALGRKWSCRLLASGAAGWQRPT